VAPVDHEYLQPLAAEGQFQRGPGWAPIYKQPCRPDPEITKEKQRISDLRGGTGFERSVPGRERVISVLANGTITEPTRGGPER
jgi:hypothetical protein